MSDKLLCTETVRRIAPGLRFKQVYGVYDSSEQFSLAQLPQCFALKPNHASGLYRLVQDKSQEDENELRAVIAGWLKLSYHSASQEPQYRDIEAKVFAEELTLSVSNFLPHEFLIFCFHGKVGFIEYEFGEKMERSIFVERNWNRLDIRCAQQQTVAHLPRPPALESAIEVAEKIATGFDFIRVDLFHLKGELVFNEVSISPWGGLVRFEPDSADKLLGKYLQHCTPRERPRNKEAFVDSFDQSNPSPIGETIAMLQSASSSNTRRGR